MKTSVPAISVASLLFSLALAAPTAKPDPSQESLDIGSRRELFVDDYLIDSMKGTALRLARPQSAEVILKADRPWEGAFNFGNNVILHEGLYRLYYRGLDTEVGKSFLCYATSRDGISWEKPNLGHFEFQGSRENNVIVDEKGQPISPNVFLDTRPGVPEKERFKGIVQDDRRGPGHTPHVIGYTSADGVRFTRMPRQPELTCTMHNCFDGDFAAFWSEVENSYVAYFRFMDPWRSMLRSTSKDLIYWTPLKVMSYGDTTREHLYVNRTIPYFRAPQIYVALPARFMYQRRVVTDEQLSRMEVVGYQGHVYYNDCSETVFMTTRPGTTRYDRTFMEGFVTPGRGAENWVSRTNYALQGVFQTGQAEMSFYVNRHYAQKSWHIERQTLRLDGFSSLNAPYEGGEMVTSPFRFSGKELKINYSTSAAGSVQVEIQDGEGTVIPGFTASDCPEIIGDEIERVVSWKGGSDLSRIAGQTICLRFVMKDADLYSLNFE